MFFLIGVPETVGLSVGIPAALILLGAVLYFVFRRRRLEKKLETLENKYKTSTSLLNTDCKEKLNRIKMLGQHSDDFKDKYEKCQAQFDEIKDRKGKAVGDLIYKTSSLPKNETKKMKESLPKIKEYLSVYEQSVNILNEELSSLLRDDLDARDSTLRTKEALREIRNFYEANIDSLRPLKSSFELLFSDAEKTFEEFDAYVNTARFNEAKDLIPSIDGVLKSVLRILPSLPAIVDGLEITIPEAIDDLEKQYSEMIENDFVLDYLKVPEFISKTKEDIENYKERIQDFDIRGIKNDMESIQNHVTDILVSFQKEKKAKEAFLNRHDSLNDASFDLEKRYTKLLKILPQYRKAYLFDERYISSINDLSDDIEEIGFLKRDIDSYLTTSDKRPYSVVQKRVEELQDCMKRANIVMDAYCQYVDRLNNDSQNIYSGIRERLFLLKEEERKIQRLGIDSISKKYLPAIRILYNMVVDINNVLVTAPVNVEKAKSLNAEYIGKGDTLIRDIEEDLKNASEAENAIVKANYYRKDFQDSRSILDEAENLYRQGKFASAYDKADSVLRQFIGVKETADA